MNQLKPNEIVYCNLTLLHKPETKKDKATTIVLRGVVYKESPDGCYHPNFKNDTLERYKVREPLKVLEIEIIVSLGLANKQF